MARNRFSESGATAFFVPGISNEFVTKLDKKTSLRCIEMLGFLRKWIKKEDGATAIEFSLVAIPYFMLSLGIMELSLMYASASLLEGATDSAARLIRTGQIQQSSDDPETLFRQAMCNFVNVLIDCSDVEIEVQTMSSYSDFDTMTPVFDEDGNMVSQGFDAGGSNDRILIRVGYRYSMKTPFIGPLLNGPDGGTLFMSTIVLQSEPYEFEDAGA